MHTAVLVLRASLVLVFATAGGAKLRDLNGSRETLLAFGLPRLLAELSGRLLPVAELTCAAGLLFQPSARWGALGCLILLLSFTAGVGYALSQGRTPACNCFGQVSSARISWRTLARNGILLAVSTVAFAEAPGSSFSNWTSNAGVANALAAAGVLLTLLLVAVLLRVHSELRRVRDAGIGTGRPDQHAPALAIGAEAPDFELNDVRGATVTLELLRSRGLPIVLVFASPTCAPCTALLPELARWAAAVSASVTIAVIESDTSDHGAIAGQFADATDLHVLTERAREVAERYHIEATPTGIGIDPDGRVATAPARGGGAIEELVRSALHQPAVAAAA